MKKFYCFPILFMILLNSIPVRAHKVNVFAYAEGDMVFSESYFPDGKPVEGGKVEVLDEKGNKILEGTSDTSGMFSFKIPKREDLTVVINASMGHKNQFVLKKEEIPEQIAAPDTGQETPQVQTAAKPKPHPPRHAGKEPLPLLSIVGGLGIIFALTALIMKLTKKK